MIQLTLTLKMTTAQVVETSVTVNNNSPIQDYVHPDDQTQPFEMTPGFKPFTVVYMHLSFKYFLTMVKFCIVKTFVLRVCSNWEHLEIQLFYIVVGFCYIILH